MALASSLRLGASRKAARSPPSPSCAASPPLSTRRCALPPGTMSAPSGSNHAALGMRC